MSADINDLKEHAWREVAAVDGAYARGEIDDDTWHREMAAIIVPKYLSAPTLQGGSGHSGTAADWEHSRGIIAEALDRDGTFLDVGCANGLLMESVARWGAEKGLVIGPYGVDIAPELAEGARKRLPHWADRIFTANVFGWRPPMKLDYVRLCLDYVPGVRRRALMRWLFEHVVAPGGRVIVGKYNEEIEKRAIEEDLIAMGLQIAGRAERAHLDPRIAYRAVWLGR